MSKSRAGAMEATRVVVKARFSMPSRLAAGSTLVTEIGASVPRRLEAGVVTASESTLRRLEVAAVETMAVGVSV